MKVKASIIICILICAGVISFQGCTPPPPPPPPGSEGPTPYALNVPGGWPKGNFLPDNPLTVEGVALGRRLFYDKILSGNKTQACGDCHHQSDGFTDLGKQFSQGAEGQTGGRNAMPLFNMNWSKGYFWDGRRPSLESLVQEPMEAHIEMNLQIDEAVERLKAHPDYPNLFSAAFPNQGVTSTTLRYAIAQFLRSIVSYNSKWDEYVAKDPAHPEKFMTAQEARGYAAFISDSVGDCFHCHQPRSPFFIDLNEGQFANNGLDAQPDTGLYKATGNMNDFGKFKTPSLRNLAFTAPYMHDGRFATLDEVLEHYNSGVKYHPNLNTNLAEHLEGNVGAPIPRINAQEKADIIAFLMLLTDSTLLTNPAYSKP